MLKHPRLLALAAALTLALSACGGKEQGQGGGMPPPWVTYSPLLPLALLMFTGLYLFALPYLTRWRSGRRS